MIAGEIKENFVSNAFAAATSNFDFDLLQGATVSGTVLDNLGLPLPQATDLSVVLGAASNYFAPPSVLTALDGTYTIGPVPPGNVLFELIAPGASGFPLQQLTNVIGGPGPQAGVDFPLLAGYVLSGTILQDDFAPAANVGLDLIPQLAGVLAPAGAVTDALGDYAISVFPGDYDILRTTQIANLQLPELQAFTMGNVDLDLDAILTLGALVQGTVTQPGLPLVPQLGVLVEIAGLLGASGLTDVNGDYSFLAPAGTHTLELLAQNGQFENMALDPLTGVSLIAGVPQVANIGMILATAGPTLVTGVVFEPNGLTPSVGVEITARNASGDVVGRTISGVGGTYALVIY